MELKDTLKAPYTPVQELNFYSINNDIKHYVIVRTSEGLEAWGDTAEEYLEKLKIAKYNEANLKAKSYIDSGDALFEFEEGKHVEATDGNIGKFTGYALDYVSGRRPASSKVEWNTKEDENVELTQEQVYFILDGLGRVQAFIWTVQFPAYMQAIQEAQTKEEVIAIEIVYTSDIN